MGRLRGYRDLTESTNLDLGGSFAHGTGTEGEGFHTSLIGADLDLPLAAAAPRHLQAPAGAHGAGVEPARSEPGRRPRPAPSGPTSRASTSSPGAGSPASGSTAPSAPTTRRSWTRARSLLLTWWPSEFSQIRGQYRHTRYGEGITANEFLFQFLFSIGAHGAHTF